MKPQVQSRIGKDGRCFPACIASILELPESAVPDLNNTSSDEVNEFLAPHGMQYSEVPITDSTPAPIGYHIICGVSPRGGMHAVVGHGGRFVHDPHPVSDDPRRGVVKPERWGILTPTAKHVTDVNPHDYVPSKKGPSIDKDICRICGTGYNSVCHTAGEMHTGATTLVVPIGDEAERWAVYLDRPGYVKIHREVVTASNAEEAGKKALVQIATYYPNRRYTVRTARLLKDDSGRAGDALYEWSAKDVPNLRAIIGNLKVAVRMIEAEVPVSRERQREADGYKAEIKEWERLLVKAGGQERRAKDRADMMALRKNTQRQGGPFHVQLTEPDGREHTTSVHALRAYDSAGGVCFACGRKLGGNPKMVDTHEDQAPYVGIECYRKIAAAGKAGWQPPKGGPRLWLLTESRKAELREHGIALDAVCRGCGNPLPIRAQFCETCKRNGTAPAYDVEPIPPFKVGDPIRLANGKKSTVRKITMGENLFHEPEWHILTTSGDVVIIKRG